MVEDILKIVEEFNKKLPNFSDGRIDYSRSDAAPVINVVVKFKDVFLLLRRSDKVSNYRGEWNVVGGYLDEVRPIREKVLEELDEELKIQENQIEVMEFGDAFEINDNTIGKKWIIKPVLVEMRDKPDVILDFEHTEFKWVNIEDLRNYKVVFGLEKTFEVLGLK